VTLDVSGEEIDPLEITRLLGVVPAYSGVVPPPPDARPGTFRPRAYWTLETRGFVPGNQLAEHLEWLATRLGDRTAILRRFAENGQAHLRVMGLPATWMLDAKDVSLREWLGVPMSFVVFVKGSSDIKRDNI
jgi:hypothetical protein